MENANRVLDNCARNANYTDTINKKEVEYLLGELSGTVYCHGHLRKLEATPITDNLFSIKTVSMF